MHADDDALIAHATSGTARRKELAACEEPLESLFLERETDSPEDALLLRAGARSLYRRSGRRTAEVPALEPAPPDVKPLAPTTLADIIAEALRGSREELLDEWLEILASRNLALPHATLCSVLDIRDPARRRAIHATLGSRGRWLASQRPETWAWVTRLDRSLDPEAATSDPALERSWDEGTIAERIESLQIWHRARPDHARELLAATLGSEPAAQRERLLSALRRSLSPADEPFLESCLDDRSGAVRGAVAELLAQIPGSAFNARMEERARRTLVVRPEGARGRHLGLSTNPPDDVDPGWTRDGLTKAPKGVGPRAHALEWLLAWTPPRLPDPPGEYTPSDVLRAILGDEYETPVLCGWTEATLRFGSAPGARDWHRPLVELWLSRLGTRDLESRQHALGRLRRLAPHVRGDAAEALGIGLIEARVTEERGLALLEFLPRPWSARLALAWLAAASELLTARRTDAISFATTAKTAACAFPSSQLSSLLQHQETWIQDTHGSAIEFLFSTARLRQRALDALASCAP